MTECDLKSVYSILISINLFPIYLYELIRAYVAPKQNKSLKYQDMQDVFLADGFIESDSPKNRRKLFTFLQQAKIKYKTEIIGHTSGKRLFARYPRQRGEKWAVKWNLEIVMRWINQKRILSEDLEKACSEPFIFNDIKEVFDKTIPYQKRYNLLFDKWAELIKNAEWTPFSRLPLRKTIMRIELLS
jgi:hypothetical protein